MAGLLGYCETKEEEDWHLEQERQAYEAARDAEEWDQMKARIDELETTVKAYISEIERNHPSAPSRIAAYRQLRSAVGLENP